MTPTFQPTGMSIEINRKRRAARNRQPMAHVENGWQHYRTDTQRCMCTDTCCHSDKGCICKTCICRVEGQNVTQI